MKLLFKQRFFSWFDSYDIYGEDGKTLYTIKGQLSWGHLLKIFNNNGDEIGIIKERVFSFLPTFEMYLFGNYVGKIVRKFSLFKPVFELECRGLKVVGDFFAWDYDIINEKDEKIATISKELFNFTDTYVIDCFKNEEVLYCLLITLAIDIEKCSRNK